MMICTIYVMYVIDDTRTRVACVAPGCGRSHVAHLLQPGDKFVPLTGCNYCELALFAQNRVNGIQKLGLY